MKLPHLPEELLKNLVLQALEEDLGDRGDVTTNAIIPPKQHWKGVLVARQEGVIAGLDLARLAFYLMDRRVKFTVKKPDGSRVRSKDVIAVIEGPARAIITGERVALNY